MNALFVGLLRRLPRNSALLIATVLLLVIVAVLSPVQVPVAIYKLSLAAAGSVAGYWVDRGTFPYARPESYLKYEWRGRGTAPDGEVDHPIVPGYELVFSLACLRRVGLMGLVALSFALAM